MTKRIGAALGMGVVMSTSSAFAHDGHGDPTWYGSAMHYLIEPEHLFVTVATIAVCVAVWRLRANHRNRTRSQDLS